MFLIRKMNLAEPLFYYIHVGANAIVAEMWAMFDNKKRNSFSGDGRLQQIKQIRTRTRYMRVSILVSLVKKRVSTTWEV